MKRFDKFRDATLMQQWRSTASIFALPWIMKECNETRKAICMIYVLECHIGRNNMPSIENWELELHFIRPSAVYLQLGTYNVLIYQKCIVSCDQFKLQRRRSFYTDLHKDKYISIHMITVVKTVLICAVGMMFGSQSWYNIQNMTSGDFVE